MPDEATPAPGTTLATGDPAAAPPAPPAAPIPDPAQPDPAAPPKPDDPDASKAKGEAQVAPEKYELKLPDGVILDEAAFKAVEPTLRELNLTNDQANKLATAYAAFQTTQVKAQADAALRQVDGWVSAVSADKEIGGPGKPQDLPAVKDAQAALARFGSPALAAFLDASGIGSHPEVIRAFAKIGALTREGQFHDGRQTTTDKRTPEQVLWPASQ